MYAEVVCGPPGSGKTTYCEGKRQFLSIYHPLRPVVVVNFDPANDDVFPYPCDVDVRELVSHKMVMEGESLGPNGSYLLCAEVICASIDRLVERIDAAVERRVAEVGMEAHTSASAKHAPPAVVAPYLLVDCPGQVEFYLGSDVMNVLFSSLQKRLRCNVGVVHLCDASIVTRDVATYVSSCLLALSLMTHHELPQVNVMTKWDTVVTGNSDDRDEDDLAGFLQAPQFLSEDFERFWRRQLVERQRAHQCALTHTTQGERTGKCGAARRDRDSTTHGVSDDFKRTRHYQLAKTLMEVVDGYGIVGFIPLDVQSEEMMRTVTQQVDNAIGNFF